MRPASLSRENFFAISTGQDSIFAHAEIKKIAQAAGTRYESAMTALNHPLIAKSSDPENQFKTRRPLNACINHRKGADIKCTPIFARIDQPSPLHPNGSGSCSDAMSAIEHADSESIIANLKH